ncbi:MAG: alpha-amylase/4-alpha-glucanotransferase domain-containing protein, partial [Polyangia bacterium]
MWLAERVWEPSLARLIGEAGVKFTLVDDGHFRAAGETGILRGYYVTEKAGVPLALFPIDQSLRQAIPFLKAWETMDVLARLRAETPAGLDAAATYGDDGEKFGVWPKTKEWVWGEAGQGGWLAEFFRLLGERQDEVRTGHFGEYLRSHPPTGRIYLPTASYEEMGEWALPAQTQVRYHEVRAALEARGELERARPFLRGGIWQSFLAKYPEANFMHKKMVRVSNKLERASAQAGTPEPAPLAKARRDLYRAQCNCCYWHGLFGGLYLNYLRDAVYHHLIDAELEAEQVIGPSPPVEVVDVDADLRPEVVLSSGDAAAYVKPDQGGGVFELDFRPKRFNLLNVLGRRPEGYHARLREAARQAHGGERGSGVQSIHELTLVKSDGLEDLLTYDQYPRLAFIDHFFGDDLTLDGLARGRFEERGDFAAGAYELVDTDGGAVRLRRRGQVGGRAVTVEKRLTLAGARLEAEYLVTAPGEPFRVTFGCEVNLTLLAGDAPDRYYRIGG